MHGLENYAKDDDAGLAVGKDDEVIEANIVIAEDIDGDVANVFELLEEGVRHHFKLLRAVSGPLWLHLPRTALAKALVAIAENCPLDFFGHLSGFFFFLRRWGTHARVLTLI